MDLIARLREDGEIVTERLGHWATTAGDRPFFHYGEDGVTMTYADFARRTDAIAGNLIANGVAKGDRVSVFCANPVVRPNPGRRCRGSSKTAEDEGTPSDLYRGLSHAGVREVIARDEIPLLPGDAVGRKGFMGLPGPFVETALLNEHDDDIPCTPTSKVEKYKLRAQILAELGPTEAPELLDRTGSGHGSVDRGRRRREL